MRWALSRAALGAFGDENDLVIASGGLEMIASIDSISVVPEPSGGLFWGGLGLLALNVHRSRRADGDTRAVN